MNIQVRTPNKEVGVGVKVRVGFGIRLRHTRSINTIEPHTRRFVNVHVFRSVGVDSWKRNVREGEYVRVRETDVHSANGNLNANTHNIHTHSQIHTHTLTNTHTLSLSLTHTPEGATAS